MEIFLALITILGLSVFETVSSLDNAIINSEVLATMSQRGKRWFLLWGLLFAAVFIRGVLPFLIIWIVNPTLTPVEIITAVFSKNPTAFSVIESSAPLLKIGGGMFLVFLFFNWLFLEPKSFGLRVEKFLYSHGIWFYGVSFVILAIVVWLALEMDPILVLAAVIGAGIFFTVHGFKTFSEEKEISFLKSRSSDMSKLIYLEIIDAVFSMDGVLGAFAFTLSIPLILLGNGLGALVVRQVTVANLNVIKKYVYLKNGAMYAILFLGSIMILESFGINIPSWLSPLVTFAIVGYAFLLSQRALGKVKI